MKRRKEKKCPIWLPYVSHMELTSNNSKVHFDFKGGSESYPINSVSSVLLYGDVEKLDPQVIETLTRKGIPLVFHRRNIATPILFIAGNRSDAQDLLEKQILFRANEKKRNHIARSLLKAKFESMSWLLPINSRIVSANMPLSELRTTEAVCSKRYWELYFEGLGVPEFIRREKNAVSQALDASSKFMSTLILRWILFHHLSPFHGFLHEPTTYPALCYDLYEPYRPWVEKWLFEEIKNNKISPKSSRLTPMAISMLKDKLDEKVYTDLTRQIVTFHELTHGAVLSLRSYLLGKSVRYMPPIPGYPNGGRPKKAGFMLYGRSAGKTDFWERARECAC